MTTNTNDIWRPISAAEVRIIADVISGSGVAEHQCLLDGLAEAEVSAESGWVLDIRTRTGASVEVSDGPLPLRTYVRNGDEYLGEILLWIRGGQLAGLEYAWVTDRPPAEWPGAVQLEIRP